MKGKHIAVLGLAFKANTDDIRFAPALEVVKRLLDDGANVRASDPEAMDRAKRLFPQVQYHEDPFEALAGPTPRCSAPSGMFFAPSIGFAPENLWLASWSSTGAISIRRQSCANWALNTILSAGKR